MNAALGLRAHSGWAALVAVAGTRNAIEVIDRRRVELGDPAIPGPKQPYHQAEGKPLARARSIIERYERDAKRRAREGLRETLKVLRAQGHEAVACGLLLASGRPLPELASILASHALIHSADGELFRDALAHAAQHLRLPITKVPEKELPAKAAGALAIPAERLQRRIAELGRELGPPWTADQKLATLVAWLTLSARQSPR